MKRKKDWTKRKLERFINEGRGYGDLEDYKPWLTIQDIPSLGRATRIYGWKTGRIHHFLSDLQTKYFYLFEWEDSILDIKEHYPLLDLREVLDEEELQELNFEKYKSEDGTDYVFTTTFLLNIRTREGIQQVARSIKTSSELERKNVIERFEIERRYWKKKNIDWGVLTNKEIPKNKVKNIEWAYPAIELDRNEIFSEGEKKYLCSALINKLSGSGHKVRSILLEFDKEYALKEGSGLLVFRYLIAKKEIWIDMGSNIDFNLPADRLIKDIKERGEYSENASNS